MDLHITSESILLRIDGFPLTYRTHNNKPTFYFVCLEIIKVYDVAKDNKAQSNGEEAGCNNLGHLTYHKIWTLFDQIIGD